MWNSIGGALVVTEYRFVQELPDLIGPEEYAEQPAGDLVRIRISVGDNGVELLGDAIRPEVLERILVSMGPEVIEQMLCG
jgi:rRNA processing protein Krr1/Pno1